MRKLTNMSNRIPVLLSLIIVSSIIGGCGPSVLVAVKPDDKDTLCQYDGNYLENIQSRVARQELGHGSCNN